MTQNEKSKIRAKVIKWVTRLFLILVAIIMLYPLAWNVVSSFKTSTEFLTDPFAWPQGLAWDDRCGHQGMPERHRLVSCGL